MAYSAEVIDGLVTQLAAMQGSELMEVLASDAAKNYKGPQPPVFDGATGLQVGELRPSPAVAFAAALAGAYLITTLDLNGKKAQDRRQEAEAMLLGSYWSRVKKNICSDWQYCERRKEFADDIKLVCSLTGFLMPLVDWPLRVTAAVVLLAVYKGPAFMIDCPPQK